MPRMQVYLPDELYAAVKERGLPASELLQDAVRAALRQQRLRDEADRYIEDLAAELGEPTPEVVARAEARASRIMARAEGRRAG